MKIEENEDESIYYYSRFALFQEDDKMLLCHYKLFV